MRKCIGKAEHVKCTACQCCACGKKSLVDSEELVLDDIVIFKAGKSDLCRCNVVSGEVRVNESLVDW